MSTTSRTSMPASCTELLCRKQGSHSRRIYAHGSLVTGELGVELSVEQGYDAARVVVLGMLPKKYPHAPPATTQMTMPAPDDVAVFRVIPEIVSVLDYTKGLAQTDLVTC
ncbi:MAG: hypothetical protein JNL87_11055 [Burkholderiaceae bacterium]|nr:hypothetical protein [Burkholderiaceae bacterium]